MEHRWSIALRKEDFRFSCAHFLIFPDGSKERLHGHNYQVSCRVEGALDGHGLVIDFNQVKPLVRALCQAFDERWLVPQDNPLLDIRPGDDGHTEVRFKDRRYLVPSDEIVVLPLNNISVENLASHLAARLWQALRERFGSAQVTTVEVAVAETSGQEGCYRISDPGSVGG